KAWSPGFTEFGECGQYEKIYSGACLPRVGTRPRLVRQTGLFVFGAVLEASYRVLLGSQRLSSSKGQTRRKAGAQSYGPRPRFGGSPPPEPRSPGCRRGGPAKSPSVPWRRAVRVACSAPGTF